MSIKVEFDFGSGWTEYEAITNDFVKTERLYKSLKPADNFVKFSVTPDLELLDRLKLVESDVPTRLTEDGILIFTGYLRKTFNIKKEQRLKPINIEIISPSFLLKHEISEPITLIDYAICDTTNPSNSILHHLLNEAGFSTTINTSQNITTVLPVFNTRENDTFYNVIERLLFEYGFIFDFDNTGTFTLYNLFPTSISTTNYFDGTNILEEIKQSKKEEEYDGVRVQFKQIETTYNTTIFSDTTNAKNGYKCYIGVDPNSYFGKDDISDSWYAEYGIEGKEIIATTNQTINIEKDPEIDVQEFTPYSTKAKLKIKNTDSTFTRYITRLDIKGDAIIKKADSYSVVQDSNSNNLKIETIYIYDKDSADTLASSLKRYYKYSDFTYQLKSKTNYVIGDIVNISDYGLGAITARVVEKKTNLQTKIYEYVCEAVTEYIPIPADFYTNVRAEAQSEQINEVIDTVNTALNPDGTLKNPPDSQTVMVTRNKEYDTTVARGTSPKFLNTDKLIFKNYDDDFKLYIKDKFHRINDGYLLLDKVVIDYEIIDENTIIYTDVENSNNLIKYNISEDTSTIINSAMSSLPKKINSDEIYYINYSDNNTIYRKNINDTLDGIKQLDILITDYCVVDETRVVYTSPQNNNVLYITDFVDVGTPLNNIFSLTPKYFNGNLYYIDSNYDLHEKLVTDTNNGNIILNGVLDYVINVAEDILFTVIEDNVIRGYFNETEYVEENVTIPAQVYDLPFYGDIESGTNTISNINTDVMNYMRVGDRITGIGIPIDTFVLRVNTNSIEINKNAVLTLYSTRFFLNGSKVLTDSEGIKPNGIKTINIDNLAITETKISDNSISTPKLQANAVTANKIMAGAVEAEKIAANAITADKIDTNAIFTLNLQSTNYIENTSGFNINKDGDVEFNNGIFRGHLEASSGTFSGELDAASGTFSGVLSSATGKFTGEFETTTLKTEAGSTTSYGPKTASSYDGQAKDLYDYFVCSQGLNVDTIYKIVSSEVPNAVYCKFNASVGMSGRYYHMYFYTYYYDSTYSEIARTKTDIKRTQENSGFGSYCDPNSWEYSYCDPLSYSETLTVGTGGDKLILYDIPTSSAGLESGQVWSDGGTLKIIP